LLRGTRDPIGELGVGAAYGLGLGIAAGDDQRNGDNGKARSERAEDGVGAVLRLNPLLDIAMGRYDFAVGHGVRLGGIAVHAISFVTDGGEHKASRARHYTLLGLWRPFHLRYRWDVGKHHRVRFGRG